MGTAKKASKQGTVGSLYIKAKQVVSDILSSAAMGAVSGAAESAVKATGDRDAAAKIAGKGGSRITKETATKSASKAAAAQKTSATNARSMTAAKTKPAAKTTAKTKTASKRSPVKKSSGKPAARPKTGKGK